MKTVLRIATRSLAAPGLCLALALGIAAPAAAQGTFKRVKPPAPGSGPRINIQVAPAPSAPEAPADTLAAPAIAEPGAAAGDTDAWFWQAVAAAGIPAGPGRFGVALEAIEAAPAGSRAAVPLAVLHGLVARHGTDMLIATIGTRVSPALVLSVAAVASGGRADHADGEGRVGLMALDPETARAWGLADRTDPAGSLRAGTQALVALLARFGGDPLLALAAYVDGAEAVEAAGGPPVGGQGRAFVPAVLSTWRVVRLLCSTPPERLSDGCVFRLPGG